MAYVHELYHYAFRKHIERKSAYNYQQRLGFTWHDQNLSEAEGLVKLCEETYIRKIDLKKCLGEAYEKIKIPKVVEDKNYVSKHQFIFMGSYQMQFCISLGAHHCSY